VQKPEWFEYENGLLGLRVGPFWLITVACSISKPCINTHISEHKNFNNPCTKTSSHKSKTPKPKLIIVLQCSYTSTPSFEDG